MNRSTAPRILLAAATAGLLALTACGDKGSTGSNQPDTVITTDGTADDTGADEATDTTTADSTDTSTPAGGGAGNPESIDVIDAELEQAIAEAEVLLGATDKDLADAKKAAANGG